MTEAPEWPHRTVLLSEAIDALVTRADGVYVDGTFGRGGHTRALLARLGASARVVAFDVDPQAVAAAVSIGDARLTMLHASFASLRAELGALGIERASGVLLDLGCQLAAARRPGARLQLSARRAARHAHGSGPRRERGAVSGPRR